MVRFASADVFDDEIPAADPLGAAPVASPRRRPRRQAMTGDALSTHCWKELFRNGRDCRHRPPPAPTRRFSPAPASRCSTRSCAKIRPSPARCASASRCEAATACAKMARLREDAANLRDAEHLAPVSGRNQPRRAHPSPVAPVRSRPLRLDAPTLRVAADLLDISDGANFEEFADALRDIVAGAEHPLAAAAGASAAAMKLFCDAPPVDAEIFALWTADLALAQRLGWDAPVPLLATTIAHPSLRRGAAGKRPRPGDPDWTDAVAGRLCDGRPKRFRLGGRAVAPFAGAVGVKTQIARQGRGARDRTFAE